MSKYHTRRNTNVMVYYPTIECRNCGHSFSWPWSAELETVPVIFHRNPVKPSEMVTGAFEVAGALSEKELFPPAIQRGWMIRNPESDDPVILCPVCIVRIKELAAVIAAAAGESFPFLRPPQPKPGEYDDESNSREAEC